MNNLFNEKFAEYLSKKSYVFIPTKEKYDSMLAAILKGIGGEKPKNHQKRKWMSK